MQNPARKELLQVIKKIPLFQGLAPSQVQKIFSLCEPHHYAAGDQVCQNKVESDEMYILVSGRLSVESEDGVEVAALEPVTTVGEMGLFTHHLRSATVRATDPSYVLRLRKGPFELALQQDPKMQIKIYRYIIEMLSGRIINDNVRTRDHLMHLVRKEKDLNIYRNRAAIALELLVEQGGLEREEIELHIDERLKEVSMRILIVDDEPDIRRFVKHALAPFVVKEAGNGKEALQMIQEEPPDLVITDIRMPEMDGLLLLTQMRKNYPEIPVLGLSGYATPEELQHYNFDGFVLKPIQPQHFRELVEETIAR